ncbi:hypothetical protein MIMGU_mgv1a004790mg [Erythranthe guttata]|uniref:Flavonoid-6-hydroxylase n=1 Tax=Erythranthe guttata TaxID=4155 RepID=A0A022R7A9_ERYGU|nr:PREDICTED: cytochrome P450 81E8-like [Erythranthe guttata]EYU36357.1 hypothetical protein MIMGU_mgv1a004790mg [Erythranthe guttata]|eukprot:XP_012838767.1 PREDICTED: cytochrome P450 81E8-like [Erythranthe guttata]
MYTLYIYLSLLLSILYITTLYILHKLQNLPPTPFPSLPFIGHLYLLKKPFHRSLTELSKRYGPIIFLHFGSRPVILVSSPSLAEECLTKNDIIFANRPSLLNGKHFGYNYTSLPWCPYGDHWRNLRRIASLDLLSSHRIQMMSQIRGDEIRILIRKLLSLAGENPGGAVYVKEALFEFTFNVMTRMVCGRRFFGESVERSKEAEDFKDVINEISKVVPDAQVLDFLPFMKWFRFRDTETKMAVIQQKRDRFMQNILEQHRGLDIDSSYAAAREKKTIAEILLEKQKEEPAYYTDEMIRNLLLVLIQAGSDTTSNTLEWAFSLLLENPRALERSQIEIDDLVGDNKRLIDESDLGKLPYLHRVIYETLRLQPAAPLLMPHKSSADCEIGGYCVPGGTMLLVNAWGIQRDPRVWEEPEKFKPERFEDSEGGKSVIGCSRWLAFGSGRRACPGENMAVRVVALALGTLIQCFDWEKISAIDMSEGTGLTAPKVEPLTAKCSQRPEIADLLSQI